MAVSLSRRRWLLLTALSGAAVLLAVLAWWVAGGLVRTVISVPRAAGTLVFAWLGHPGQAQNFHIQSESNRPALIRGDKVVSYRIAPSQVGRGDLVVVRHPKTPSIDYVSRVIGLPGEMVQLVGGEVLINGTPLKRAAAEGDRTALPVNARYWVETTPEGKSYRILDVAENGPLDDTPLQRVPEGHYWLLSNNRDNAIDSRLLAQFGFVPAANVYRKPAMIYWSPDRARIGMAVE